MFWKESTNDQTISIYESEYKHVLIQVSKPIRIKNYVFGFAQKYIKSVTTILYYICYIPFKLENKWNSDGGFFEVQICTNMIQMTFCLALHLLLVVLSFFMISARFGPDENGYIRPSTILDSALSIFGAGTTWFFVYTAWFQKTNFLVLSQPDISENRYAALKKSPQMSFEEKLQNFISTFAPLIIIITSFYEIGTKTFKVSFSNRATWTAENLIRSLLVFQIIMYNLPNYIFQSATLRFRDRAKYFLSLIFSSTNECRIQVHSFLVLREYDKLEEFVNQLNDKFGSWLMMVSLLTIPFLSKQFVELFKGSKTFFNGICTLLHLFSNFFYLLIAASVSQNVNDGMRKWLNDNVENIRLSNNKMSILLSRLNSNPIALRGRNFFNIIYSFVGSVISLVITFAFIDQNKSFSLNEQCNMGVEIGNSSIAL